MSCLQVILAINLPAAGGNRPRHCEHLRKTLSGGERNMPR